LHVMAAIFATLCAGSTDLRAGDFFAPAIVIDGPSDEAAEPLFARMIHSLPQIAVPAWNPTIPSLIATSSAGRFEAALGESERPGVTLTFYEESAQQQAANNPNQASVAIDQNGQGPRCFEVETPQLSFTDDLCCFFPRLGHDAWGVVNNWNNLAILGIGLGGSLAIRSELDDSVRNWTAEHPDRWGKGSTILEYFGDAQYQIPVILGAYAYTVWAQDIPNHEMMTSMISAFTITGLSTVAIKGIADTRRPSDSWNGGNYGFPSYHDASLFAISAVLDDYEGHWIGYPMYVLSGLVGFARIDTRDHDLSDVVFGAVLGYVIGKSVAGRALYGDSRVHILPYVHPTDGSPGIMIDASF
jgi:membrane-associated phospholipid phosphatase